MVKYYRSTIPNVNDLFEDICTLVGYPVERLLKSSRVRIDRGDEAFTARVELPGYTKEQVDVVIKDKILEIQTKETDDENLEDFSYRASIPSGIDVENVSAKLENGVLTIIFPLVEKKELSKSITIE